jgi:hypothetical protein
VRERLAQAGRYAIGLVMIPLLLALMLIFNRKIAQEEEFYNE